MAIAPKHSNTSPNVPRRMVTNETTNTMIVWLYFNPVFSSRSDYASFELYDYFLCRYISGFCK